MQKGLAVFGVLAVVLAVTAGAGATVRSLITGSDVRNNSLTGADIKDRSLHFTDLALSGETMIRQGWRLATGRDKVTETMLDPALAAKIDVPPPVQTNYLDILPRAKTEAGVIATRGTAQAAGDVLWAGVTFQLPIPAAFIPTVLEEGQKTTDCNGTYAAPAATGGHLCIYLGPDSANAGGYTADPMANLGFRFTWKADDDGSTSVQATYAFTAA